MKFKTHRAIIGMITVLTVGGCTTVKMPKLDFVKFPEFLEEARNFDAYPKVSEAPQAPNDLKSAEEWDKAAREIMATRNASPQLVNRPEMTMTPEEFQALKAQVRAYKLDDPQ